VYVCVYTHAHTHCMWVTQMCASAWRQDAIWTNCFFSCDISYLPKKKSKRCERDTKSSNPNESELQKPSTKVPRLLFEVIQEIIIIVEWKSFAEMQCWNALSGSRGGKSFECNERMIFFGSRDSLQRPV